jgi:hypothetical protein
MKNGDLKRRSVFGVIVLILIATLPLAKSLNAQGTTATVQGRVFDNTDAVIPGANVTSSCMMRST